MKRIKWKFLSRFVISLEIGTHPAIIPVTAQMNIADCMTERESSWEGDDDTGADKYMYAPQNPYIAQNFSQTDPNDLTRDLDLPKISA